RPRSAARRARRCLPPGRSRAAARAECAAARPACAAVTSSASSERGPAKELHAAVGSRPVAIALGAAARFGSRTPCARALGGTIDPLWLAGLLYAGSGVGLSAFLLARRLGPGRAAALVIAVADVPWLAAAILCGGIIAPVLFTFGLRSTSGASASLLLNLET